MMKKHLLLVVLLVTTAVGLAQNGTPTQKKKDAVQISGLVLTNDSVPQFIPYANVLIKARNVGTTTNAEGFFSFAAAPGDTIQFSVIGFKKEKLYIPDTLKEKEYLARIVMRRDTTLLQQVDLYPWPTPDRFKDEFLRAPIKTTEDDIAMRNLAVEELKQRAAGMGYSPEEIQDFVIQARNMEIYNYGRYNAYQNGGSAILGSLTDPFAWAQFFNALKRGDFSSKKQ